MNDIDAIFRMQIKSLLEFWPTLLLVEHDKAFCENVETKTVRL